MLQKIKTLSEISTLLELDRSKGCKVVHCHGVFDLLHPGHIKHLQSAKSQGDKLVVTITPDRHVNKGPGRPAFNEQLRLEQLAALTYVDYVVLNDSPDAVSIIRLVKPDVYVKGKEYSKHEEDITGKIAEESQAVLENNGKLHYTQDIVFSSSTLINRFFDNDAKRLKPFLTPLKERFSAQEIIEKVENLADLKVLVIGDAILDEYQYVDMLGQSGKGLHMTACCLDNELFLGGSLIIAKHLANFAGEVSLLSSLGKECVHNRFIYNKLGKKIKPFFTFHEDLPTLTKKRYVYRDGSSLTKLFETYSSNQALLNESQIAEMVQFINQIKDEFDLIVVCDFGNGFINHQMVDALAKVPAFLALNTQTNSGNRGYNMVTNYQRADFVSINAPELRLAMHDRTSRIETLAHDIAALLNCPEFSVTQGVEGVCIYSRKEDVIHVPALTSHSIDRVGAGDSYFALAALCAAKGYPPLLSGFIGSVAAALDVQIVGNKDAVRKIDLCKFVTRLCK